MTDHQHPTAKPEANWRTCSRAEYDALPDLSAKPEGEGTPVEQVKAQELLANNNRRMDAYYYGFDPTGVPEIDAVLSAVATAGKAYHHTDSWSDDDCGFSYSGLIQAAANLAASRLSASPPVPAVAGDTRPVEATWSDGKTHAYVNMQAALSAEAKEWRRKIGLRIVSFTFLDFDTSPTPSADQSGPQWVDGLPSKHHAKEWFIAETSYGDRVVLKALPEEYSYDFKTADETYIKADKITRWMPFPDSQYKYPEPADQSGVIGALEAVLSEKLERRTLALDEANARIGALVEALEEIERASYANSEEEGIARQALAAHAASIGQCDLPPEGWVCTRPKGHENPCAAVPKGDRS